MIWKLIRRDGFDKVIYYFMEGDKRDLFTLIGYMYSCFDVGTKRIDYKEVSRIAADVEKRIADIPGLRKVYYEYVGDDIYGEVYK